MGCYLLWDLIDLDMYIRDEYIKVQMSLVQDGHGTLHWSVSSFPN